jgi:oligopeptidase B
MTSGALILMTMISACGPGRPDAPVAEKRPVELERHGHIRVDDYFWLNQRDDPDVLAHLEAENAYADSRLEASSGLRSRLIGEMKARIKEDDASAPYRYGDYYYYHRFEAGREYAIHARKRDSLDAGEEIILDINALAGDETYFHVAGVRVSPDHSTLAYGVDTRGRRFFDLRFIDLETGEHLDDVVEAVTPYFEWSADGKAIIYVRQDPETLRWYQAYHHLLGSDEDELLYEEADETFSVYTYKSVSGQHVFLASESTTSTEIRYVPADDISRGFEVFLPREEDHEYSVQDGGDRFYILSNDGAENFRVLEAPHDDTSKSAWQVVIDHRDDVLVEGIDVFAGHIAVSGVSKGVNRLEILERADNNHEPVTFAEDAFLVYTTDNYEYERGAVRYMYESMTTPPSVFDLGFETGEATLVKRKEIPGGFDPADYHSERLSAEARDGTPIPVSLVYRKGIELDGSNPLLQYGYGSYGSSVDPFFSANLLSLLDRGFVFAIAHIRGGSEMGRQWYYDGRQLEKMNTFTDFIDVSKFLIREGYTSPGHLYARGGSAGGLLMGAVVNMAPELYHGISTRVPFVDVVTTMLDESIPLTTSEWDEWGDPRQRDYYDYMLSYSPYDQVRRQDYPNMLVTAGLHDSQVQYWEPAKWVAKLRDHKTDDNLLLLVTDMQAGHSGKTGRFQRLEDAALYYAFYLELEGIGE